MVVIRPLHRPTSQPVASRYISIPTGYSLAAERLFSWLDSDEIETMNIRRGTHRADVAPDDDSRPHDEPPTSDDSEESGSNGVDGGHDDRSTQRGNDGSPRFSDDQRREWRRWIVETFLTADYGVVPVDHLVDELVEREPEAIDRSTVRAALTERLLPQLAHESVLEYDADRELLINYGN